MSTPSGHQPRALIFEPFDPGPSLRLAVELLQAAGVSFAVAGRLAVWAWVPPDQQEFTKDVDFAVPEQELPRLELLLRARGYTPLPLAIGGVAIRNGATRIDFIDRRVDYGELFAEAVKAAKDQGTLAKTLDGTEIPVVPAEYMVAMKLGTGDPRDERDVQRIVSQPAVNYDRCRMVTRTHAGPAAANRLDFLAAQVGRAEAARYVRDSAP